MPPCVRSNSEAVATVTARVSGIARHLCDGSMEGKLRMTAPMSGLPAPLTAHLEALRALLARISQASVEALYLAIWHAYQRDAQIFIVGNGGSAATATHFACDLGKNTRAPDRRRARVLALCDNVSALTAWANDDGYASVFAEQLAGFVNPHDLLVAISGSGNSPNVLSAVDYTHVRGAHTIALTGFDGGRLAPAVEHALVVPSDSMELIEDVHLAVCHTLTAALRVDIAALSPSVFSHVQPVACSANGDAPVNAVLNAAPRE